MPGPPPKHPSARARRNRVAGARTLTVAPKRAAPQLPPRPQTAEERKLGLELDWHDMTVEWWHDVWQSPMAAEYDPSDLHGLYLLAMLVDAFWWTPSKDLAAEIRQQGQRFGLSPIDRRRLQWEIDRGDEADERTAKRRSSREKDRPRPKVVDDPRSILSA